MRLRILPVLILMAMAMLGLRLGDIWHGFGGIAIASNKGGTGEAFAEDPFEDVQLAQAEAQQQAQAAPESEGEGESESPTGSNSKDASQLAKTAPDGEGVQDPLSMSDAEIEILQQLSKRRQKLDRREAKLNEKEQILKAAQKRLKEDVTRLESLKKEIQSLLIDYDSQEDKQVKRLVNIYSNMDAEDAARIFEDLDMKVLLKVIDRMNERRTAPILAEMQAAKAQALTLELAKRKDLPVPESAQE